MKRNAPCATLRGEQGAITVQGPGMRAQQLALVVIRGRFLGRKYDIPVDGLTIGRSNECDVMIGNAADGTSRRHAQVKWVDGRLEIHDLGSTNGLLLNRRPAHKAPLRPNDVVRIGETLLKLVEDDDELQFHEEIYRMAVCDPLTGLYNRTHFDQLVGQEISRARRNGLPLSMILIDLDHFKQINDTHGHVVGDGVLRKLGRVLRQVVRRHDIACRFGGDEFVVLLPNTDQEAAMTVAERCRGGEDGHRFRVEGKTVELSLSLGVAELQAAMERPESLIMAADEALYVAKDQGRNCIASRDDGPDETNRLPRFEGAREDTPRPSWLDAPSAS